jgi:hypothetical protein
MALSDGPLLGEWTSHRWSVLRAMARWEMRAYQELERMAPDLVIKLHVSPSVSVRRKVDGTIEDLSRRTDAVGRIRFPGCSRVVDIDADQPLDSVLLRVKQAVWEAL